MKFWSQKLLTVFIVLAILGAGCSGTSNVETSTVISNPPAPTPAPTPSRSAYEPFVLAKHQAARAAGEPLYLYFYANWCPTCREQEPRNVEVFKNFSGRVHGFRINFNDSDTDQDEKAMAEQFRVPYQHTAIFLDKNGTEIKRVIGKQSSEDLEAALKLISNLNISN